MDSENCIITENASYIGFSTVMKSLDANILDKILSITKIDRIKKGSFFKVNGIFMGTLRNELHYPHNNSMRLLIDEWSVTGKTGLKFYLFLYNKSSEEWQNYSRLLKTINPASKHLIMFQNILYQLKNDEVEFHFTTTKSVDVTVWVKNFFNSYAELRIDEYKYITLTKAADTLSQRCNVYGVVDKILKVPSETSRKTIHGMCLLIDPSCYEGANKKKEYPCHIFASDMQVYPSLQTGDIIRIHRAKLEPRENKLPDFRVWREHDVVIFPLNGSQAPRSSAAQFTLSQEDFEEVDKLKKWFSERYEHEPTAAVKSTATEPHLITLNEITCEKLFSLSCRLVEYFDEGLGQGIALWVEDGTRCPLFTCSDSKLEPYDSQETQDFCNNCSRICVRTSKQLIPDDLVLERNMFLFLRQVETSVHFTHPNIGNVVQFEVKGQVELLPVNTRYHKTLVQRLKKENSHPLQSKLQENVNCTAQPDVLPISKVPPREAESSDMEISEFQSSFEATEARTSIPLQPYIPTKDRLLSSGEYSTEKAMVEMPSDVFCSFELEMTSWSLAQSDLENKRRNHLPKPSDSQVLASQPENVISSADINDISFGQVVTSTQKQDQYIDISNAQSLFTSNMESIGKLAKTAASADVAEPTDSSPNPTYRAVEEVLDIRTRNSSTSPVESHRKIAAVETLTSTSKRCGSNGRLLQQYTTREAHPRAVKDATYLVEKAALPKRKLKNHEEVNETSRLQITEMITDASQDSDEESIIVFNPSSQLDFEKFFDTVETLGNEKMCRLKSLGDVQSIAPDSEFQFRAYLTDILPRCSDGALASLENLLIAFCSECKRIWQYSHFKDSTSRRVRRRKKAENTRRENLGNQVINYLCSEEEHERNLHLLMKDTVTDSFEYDEECHIDYSYAYVCPLCKLEGVPDSLCQLEPSFFFWLHVTKEEEDDCLHVMASGIHAEYFLGTKADHVCRSPDIWKRADERRRKLLEFGAQQPFDFCVRKSLVPKELYLENTFVVYSSKHLLPW